MKFIFDLDGTLTECETLPKIAKELNVSPEIAHLTAQTVKGDIPFMESFVRRVEILGKLDVGQIASCLNNIPINEKINAFINENRENCLIATGNYRGWISEVLKKIHCHAVSSEGEIDPHGKVRLTKILKKEDVVKRYQEQGETVVFIGDGNNDAEAMRIANISIACGLVHPPAQTVMQVADYAVYDATALVRLLNQIKEPQKGKSVVISAAGVGSRLGLGQTKSLIKLLDQSLIEHQLKYFTGIEDLRIVVGFQAKDLIHEVLKTRKDVVFVFNHDYFHTKTGTSLYLGAKHANEMVIAWDGDLIVHPDDIDKCLAADAEYIGISHKSSEDAVFVKLNAESAVTEFTFENGDYEWSGPACINRKNIQFTVDHVYSLLEPLLPLQGRLIRAQDIDTYEDYKKAIEFVKSWEKGNSRIDSYYDQLAKKIAAPTEIRNKAPDFSKFDIDFIRSLPKKNASLLDLGAGTGLLVNHLINDFDRIVAVEKYAEFSRFIKNSEKLQIIHANLLNFDIDKKFDMITLFGVMNYFNREEAACIYKKAQRWLSSDGLMIVKHQMGCEEDVIVDGYSEELKTEYYSEYRHVENEIALIKASGFEVMEIKDIYPPEFNRWDNTHFYALVCKNRDISQDD